MRYVLSIFVLLSFLIGCKPASVSPEPNSISKATSTLMPSTQSASSWWHPTVGLTWQWQIGNNDIDTSIAADVYDIDLYVDQTIIDELHAKRRKVICYMSVASWETWGPGRDLLPPAGRGEDS